MENMLNTYFDAVQAIENSWELHEVQKSAYFKFLSLQISFLISIKSKKSRMWARFHA